MRGGSTAFRAGVRLLAWSITAALFAGVAWADDVNITSSTNNGISLDGFAGTTAKVFPGVTVADTTFTINCSSFASICATTHAWTLTNQGAVGPSNFGDAVNFKSGGNVINFGTIDGGSGGNGVWIEGAPGSVDNRAGATIHGTNGGVVFKIGGPAGTVTNAGTINAESIGAAVSLGGGGIFTNLAGGVVHSHGDSNAVSLVLGTSRTVINSGLIQSNDSGFATGVAIQNGTVTNNASGQILGAFNGIWANGSGPATITNHGLVEASKAQGGGSAIEADGGGTIVNSGTIRSTSTDGSDAGIQFTGAGTIFNGGTIASLDGGKAILFQGNDAHTLVLSTGSVLVGDVQAGSGTDGLVLSGVGTESAAKFLGFKTLAMQGSEWTLMGNGTFATSTTVQSGVLHVAGRLQTAAVAVNGGTLDVAGTLISTGVTVNSGGTLTGTGVVDPPTITIASGGSWRQARQARRARR